ncbi:MAG TPA: carboxypeptidase regulatory-like domain-containing protein [Xanthobacteraceae bacterium]
MNFRSICACALVLWFALLTGTTVAAVAQTPALTGEVTSAQEGAMEGVLVSAHADGSPLTITVASDAHGHYAFPADRLAAGRYALAIRAVGYALAAPVTATVTVGHAATADLRLAPAADLAVQLTSTEWLISMPGTAEQKRPLIECMSCHTLERVVRSTYTADQFMGVLARMENYANNSTTQHPQLRVVKRVMSEKQARALADYVATINLSGRQTWSYPLETLPRPRGRATHVIITEYALPRPTIAPHDVRRDAQGFVWYSNFVEPYLGRLDPKTGAHKEFRYDLPRPNFPAGALALEPDQDGNWWLSLMFQSGLMRFDPRTEKFRYFPLPSDMLTDASQQSLLMPGRAHVDGKVWTNDVSTHEILRLDVASGHYERIDPFRGLPKGRLHSPYGMAADAQNDLYFMDFGDESVGRVDAKTLATTLFPTPTPRSRPRRCMMDDAGHLWFAEFAANKVAMFDTKTENFKEWDVPTPHTYPYDVYLDRTGTLWSAGMSSDRVLRFDPASRQSIEYLLPHPTNIRRIFIDDTTTPPTFWAGNNHHASILRLEPLD